MIIRTVNIHILSLVITLVGCLFPVKVVPYQVSLSEISPNVIQIEGASLFQYWEIDHESYLWDDGLGEVIYLNSYIDSVSKILEQHRFQSILEERETVLPSSIDSTLKESLGNEDLVKYGFAGRIATISFIESEILNYQLSRYPLLSHPTEFHGFILESIDKSKIRIYFASSDQPWPPKATPLISHIEKDLTNGWQLKYHLHNHYESENEGYIGKMSASLADVHYFKILRSRFNLTEARITNGFSTLILMSSDFDLLKSN